MNVVIRCWVIYQNLHTETRYRTGKGRGQWTPNLSAVCSKMTLRDLQEIQKQAARAQRASWAPDQVAEEVTQIGSQSLVSCNTLALNLPWQLPPKLRKEVLNRGIISHWAGWEEVPAKWSSDFDHQECFPSLTHFCCMFRWFLCKSAFSNKALFKNQSHV